MESLESKLDRLSGVQRKEVEDFVDFLMSRSGNPPESPAAVPVLPRIQNIAPPPFIIQETVQVPEDPPAKEYETPPVENPGPVQGEQPVPLREISVAGDDRIARDYMDYGQFDKNNSPAVAAVKKVKEKLQKREANEKPTVSLDWID